MPIRINLLEENLVQEEQRRKDPVKRAVWIGGFVVFLVGLWALRMQTTSSGYTTQRAVTSV